MKIGLVRFSSLGDVILTTGIIRELKRKLGNADLTMITSSRYADIFKFDPYLDRTIALEGKRFKDFSKLIGRLRSVKLDILVDLQLNPRSLFTSATSGSRKKLRYSKSRWVRSMMVLRKDGRTCNHITTRYFKPFEKVGLKWTDLRPQIWIDNATKRSVDRLIANGETRIVAVSPGAKRPTKRWLAEEYGRLCRLLVETERVKVVVVGDAHDTEVAGKIEKIAGGDVIDLTGKTSLLQLASVLDRSSVLVTNDSGPMHMATAVNTPTVAIFGPTVPEFGFSPLGQSEVIEKELPCRPCSLHGSERCKKNGFKCMSLITAEEVLDVVSGVLNGQQSNKISKRKSPYPGDR